MRRTAFVGVAAVAALAATLAVLRLRGNATEAASLPSSLDAAPAATPSLAARPGGGDGPQGVGAPEDALGTIHGVVVRPDGEPIGKANVLLLQERPAKQGGPVRLREVATTETDAQGRFRVRPPRSRSDGFWVRVDAGPETPVGAARATLDGPSLRIALSLRRSVTVKVLDPEGRPARGVGVRVAPGGGETTRPEPEQPPETDWTPFLTWDRGGRTYGSTDGAGEAQLWLDAGPFLATVTPPIELRALTPPPVAFDGDRLTVRLESGCTVAGVLRDRDGQPVSKAFVWWRTPDRPWKWKRAGADGSYSIESLQKGAIELWAEAFGSGPPEGAKTTETVTERYDADLVVDLGEELHVRVENWPAGATGTPVLRDRAVLLGRLGVLPVPVSASGEAVLRRLQRGHSYSLRVETDDGKLAAIREAVLGGDAPLRVRVSPTGSLHVTLDADVPFFVSSVIVADFDLVWSDEDEGPPMAIRLDGLPSGRLAIEVSARSERGKRLRAVADADVPGNLRLRLEEVRDTANR